MTTEPTQLLPAETLARGVRRAACRSAFTLIEVLVVMGIIVLLIALALPAFSFITGSRSNEAATNQISAAMGIARAQAVGLQKVFGLMFFIEPTSDRVQLALVQEVPRPSGPDVPSTAVDAAITTYLDLVDDTEFIKLPVGVSVQTVTNGMTSGANTGIDRYIGFNVAGCSSSGATFTAATSKLQTKVGGVILFDANGQLTARTYALRTRKIDNSTTTPTAVENRMGALLFYNPNPAQADINSRTTTPADYIPAATPANAPVSQLGMVLYDATAFATKGFTIGDYRADATANPAATESGLTPTDITNSEETWLDGNGLPIMVNRYNGTLVRGE